MTLGLPPGAAADMLSARMAEHASIPVVPPLLVRMMFRGRDPDSNSGRSVAGDVVVTAKLRSTYRGVLLEDLPLVVAGGKRLHAGSVIMIRQADMAHAREASGVELVRAARLARDELGRN